MRLMILLKTGQTQPALSWCSLHRSYRHLQTFVLPRRTCHARPSTQLTFACDWSFEKTSYRCVNFLIGRCTKLWYSMHASWFSSLRDRPMRWVVWKEKKTKITSRNIIRALSKKKSKQKTYFLMEVHCSHRQKRVWEILSSRGHIWIKVNIEFNWDAICILCHQRRPNEKRDESRQNMLFIKLTTIIRFDALASMTRFTAVIHLHWSSGDRNL